MSERRPYRTTYGEYEEVKKEIQNELHRARVAGTQLKKDEWAREITEMLKELPHDEAQYIRDLFQMGAASLKTEEKVEYLKNVMRWIMHVRKSLVWEIIGDTPETHQRATVFERYAKTLDANVFLELEVTNTPPMYFPTVEEVEGIRARYAPKIFRDYHNLRKILNHYEAIIGERWGKRNRKARQKVLSSNWEATYIDEVDLEGTQKLARNFRMDIAMVLGYESPGMKGSHNQWPFISGKALADKAEPFLMMLHSRANSPPGTFWGIDYDSTHFRGRSRVDYWPWMMTHGMVFAGHDTPEEYGRLVPEKELARTSRGILCSEAILVMKIQGRLYDFLVRCCVQIMNDTLNLERIDHLPEFPDEQPKEVPPKFVRDNVLDEPYYRLLPVLEDINDILKWVEMRHNDAIANLVSMRDDPAYFHSSLHQLADHSPEMVQDIYKRKIKYDDADFWQRTVRCLIFLSIGLPLAWGKLIEFLRDVQAAFAENPNALQQQELPSSLRIALINLETQLEGTMKFLVEHAWEATCCSEPMRDHFCAVPVGEAGQPQRIYTLLGSEWDVAAVESMKSDWGAIVTCLGILRRNMRVVVNDSPMLVELDRRMDSNTNEGKNLKRKMTGYVRERFNDILLVSQCCMQVNRFQPWAVSKSFRMDVDPSDRDQTSDTQDTPQLHWLEQQVIQACEKISISSFTRRFSNKNLKYSLNDLAKNPTKERLIDCHITEKLLDNFWTEVDEALEEIIAGAYEIPRNEVFPRPRQGRFRTPTWEGPETIEKLRRMFVTPRHPRSGSGGDNGGQGGRSRSSSNGEKKRKRYYLCEGAESFGGDGEEYTSSTTGRALLRPANKKIKRRPDPPGDIPEGGQAATEPEQPAEPEPQPLEFEIERKTMLVLERLWFVGPLEGSSNLEWGNFLGFMREIGFEWTLQGGSVWRFTPPDQLAHGGTVNFHAPHNQGHHVLAIARTFGRRLSEHYGLFPENFVERVRGGRRNVEEEGN